jgi:hypothetical protein
VPVATKVRRCARDVVKAAESLTVMRPFGHLASPDSLERGVWTVRRPHPGEARKRHAGSTLGGSGTGPVFRQAWPYPRRASETTSAPAARATSAVLSRDPLSTTRTLSDRRSSICQRRGADCLLHVETGDNHPQSPSTASPRSTRFRIRSLGYRAVTEPALFANNHDDRECWPTLLTAAGLAAATAQRGR